MKNAVWKISHNIRAGSVLCLIMTLFSDCALFTPENLILKMLSKWLHVTTDIEVDFNGMKLLS